MEGWAETPRSPALRLTSGADSAPANSAPTAALPNIKTVNTKNQLQLFILKSFQIPKKRGAWVA